MKGVYIFGIITLLILAIGFAASIVDQVPETGYTATVNRVFDLTEFKTIVEYNGTNPLYLGKALPGTNTNVSTWMIKKFVYNGTQLINILYANSSSDFIYKWDNRTTYTYG